MRNNKVKALWQQGRAPTMAWLSTVDTYIAEAMANVGFDVLVLDMQHGMTIGPDRAGAWLQAVSTTDTMPMVRIPWNEPVFIQWVLDAGAYGVIVPLVNSREEATKAGGACRYPPAGYRSVGPNRVIYYSGPGYLEQVNKEIICLVMVEDINTVSCIDDLAEAPGIDGFYIGPVDLALTMGIEKPWAYQNSLEHAGACQKVLDAAEKYGLVAGIHCMSADEAVQRTSQGFMLCPSLNDVGALTSTARATLKMMERSNQIIKP